MPELNLGWLLFRIIVGITALALVFLSQRFWFRALWRVSRAWGSTAARVVVRSIYLFALLLVIVATYDSIHGGHGRIVPRGTMVTALAGFWYFSGLFSYVSVKFVHLFDGLWRSSRRLLRLQPAAAGYSGSEGA